MVLLSTIIPAFAISIQSVRPIHQNLQFFNAIALIFRSSLGVVFHFRPHFPNLEESISLPNTRFVLTVLMI